MPSRVIDTIPSTTKLRMNIVAKTGRLMEVSEIHMMQTRQEADEHERQRAATARTRVPGVT